MVSNIDGYQGLADEFIEGSSKNFEESPSERPTISTKNVQSNADNPNGLKGLKKEFKHGRLNMKDLYKQLEPFLTTSASGKNNVQNPKRKRKQKQPRIDNEVDPEEINTNSERGSGELYHLNEKTIYKKLPPLYKTSSSKGMSANSNIQVTGTNVPVGKQGLGSTEKGPPIKSSQESLKQNQKRKRPPQHNEVNPEEINMDRESGSRELPHLNKKTIYKKLAPLHKTRSSRGMSANSNIQVTGTKVTVGKQGLGSIEKGPPIKSSQESPKQNPKRKRKRPRIEIDVDPEVINTDSESGSGELYHLNEKTIYEKLPPLYKTSSSKGMSSNSNIQVTGTNVPVGKQAFGSMEKGLPTKSSQESPKQIPKREQPPIDDEVDLKEINMDSERGSRDVYRDMFGSEEPGNVVDPHLRTGVKDMKIIHSHKKGRLGA